MDLNVLRQFGSQPVRPCLIAGCDQTKPHHADFRPLQEDGFVLSGMLNPWTTLLRCLAATNVCIPEITMESGHEMQRIEFDTDAFALTVPQLGDATCRFQALTKLRLALNVEPRFNIQGVPCAIHPNLITLLSAAKNLQCLTLELNERDDFLYEPFSAVEAILGRCEFPHLKSIILAFFWSTEQDLLRLLYHSPKLEQLTLASHTLHEGSWENILNTIRQTLRLKSVRLSSLEGGLPCNGSYYCDFFGDVNNFFFRGGENPFNESLAKKRSAELRRGGRNGAVFFQMDYIGRYYEFHGSTWRYREEFLEGKYQ